MTLTDALTRLRDSLPANPGLDDEHQAAIRVVVGAVHPVTWRDEFGVEHDTWSRNHFTGEIERDLDGDPLYTPTPPTAPATRLDLTVEEASERFGQASRFDAAAVAEGLRSAVVSATPPATPGDAE